MFNLIKMSRYQSSKDWMEKKSYLIRSLFEDVSVLSPIQEEQKSRLSSIRSDLCDELDEFYEKLAKQTKRRPISADYSASDSTCSVEALKKFEEYEELVKTTNNNGSRGSQEQEEIKTDHTKFKKVELKGRERSCKIQNENEIEEYSKSSIEENFTSDDKIYFKHIEVPYNKNSRMEDAYEATSERYSRTIYPVESCFKSVQKNNETTRHKSDVDIDDNGEKGEEDYEEEEYESLTVNRDARRPTDNCETSLQSSTSNPDSIGDKSNDIQPIETGEASNSYGPKKEAKSSNSLNTIFSTSTPKSARKSKTVRKIFRNRSIFYSSSPRSCKSTGVQTSFSDDVPVWTSFWNQLFVGTPTVYKLCSCKNHVCS